MNEAALQSLQQHPELPQWFAKQLRPVNTDFSKRVVCLPDDAHWVDTSLAGIQMRIMEFTPGAQPRLAAQLRFSHAHEPIILGNHPDLEILIQAGHLTSRIGDYHANWYYRLPDLHDEQRHKLAFQRDSSMDPSTPAVIYLAIGQMMQSDTEWRRIDTTDESRWFPGPVEGTDVIPLHGHGAGNVMMLRWNTTAAFKPRIDPRGEELLVLKGAVYDAQGFYPEGSWIRNPIVSWQAWGAKKGTVVYYKNGHFADSETLKAT